MQNLRNHRDKLQLFLMIVVSLITQFAVLAKSAAIAGIFGVGIDIDAYNAVHNVANFLFNFISSGITTVLIPAYLTNKKQRSIDSFMTILYVSGIGIILLVTAFHSQVSACFSGNNPAFSDIANSIFLITIVSQYFNTIIGVTVAYFQVKDKFNIPKICTLVCNLLLLLIILMDPAFTIYKYALSVAGTTILNAVVQVLIALRYNYRYKVSFEWKNPEVIEMLRIYLPTVLSAGLYQITLLTDTLISSHLGVGQISILTYSNHVINMVNSLFAVNIITYLFPKIAQSMQLSFADQQKKLFGYLYFGQAIMGLMVVGFLCVGKEFIMLLFEHGKFSSQDTMVVFFCISLYMMFFPFNIARDLIYRFFYAKGNTAETVKNSVIVSIFNLIISIILSKIIGIYGVVLGTGLSAVLSFSMILFRMRQTYGNQYSKKVFWVEECKLWAGILLTVVIIAVLKQFICPNYLISIVLYGILSVVIYFFCIFLVRSKALKVQLS